MQSNYDLGLPFRHFFRLTRFGERIESVSHFLGQVITLFIAVIVQRFEEVINGREYEIEVSLVSRTTWCARLGGVQGGASALMPFYGDTPDEAAQQLTNWLTLAHRNAQKSV